MVQNIKKYWKFSVVILIAASVSVLFAIFQSPSAIASDETIGVGDLAPGQQIDLTGNSVVLKFCVNTACQPTANVTFQKEGAFSFIARNITVRGVTSSCNYDFNIFYNSGDTQASFKTKQNGEGGLLGCPLKSNTASSPFNVTPADINIKTSAVYETCEVGLSGEEKAACLDGAANSGNTSYCDKYSAGSSLSNACKKGQTAQASDTAATAPSGGATTGSSPESAGAATQAEPTCANLLGGIGWWVCAPLELAIGFSDLLWGLMEGLLVTNPLLDTEPYYQPWTILRNVANTLLAVILLVVVFSQVSNIGISNYGIKKLLPRLIVVAVLVNISFLVVQLSVDLANILGSELSGFMKSLNAATPAPTWSNAMETIITGAAGGLALTGIAGVAGSMAAWPAIGLLLAILIILAIIGIFVGMLTLVIRNGLIPIIAILAPVAFVAYALPNTQGLFDKWKKLFFGILFLYPAAALYMGALQFASALLIVNGGIIETIVGLTALYVGSAFIPIIALKSNSTMSKIYGGLSNAVGKVTRPATKLGMGVAGGMAALKFAQFKNLDHSSARGPGSRGFLGRKKITRAIGRTGQWFDRQKRDQQLDLSVAKAESQRQYDTSLLQNQSHMDKLSTTAAGASVVEELEDKAIKVEAAKHKNLGHADRIGLILRPDASNPLTETQKSAALQYISETGTAEEMLKAAKLSDQFGGTGRSILAKGFQTRGFTKVLGNDFPDKIRFGDPITDETINRGIIQNINKGIGADALLVDPDLSARVSRIAASAPRTESADADPDNLSPTDLAPRKVERLAESANIALNSPASQTAATHRDLPVSLSSMASLSSASRRQARRDSSARRNRLR